MSIPLPIPSLGKPKGHHSRKPLWDFLHLKTSDRQLWLQCPKYLAVLLPCTVPAYCFPMESFPGNRGRWHSQGHAVLDRPCGIRGSPFQPVQDAARIRKRTVYAAGCTVLLRPYTGEQREASNIICSSRPPPASPLPETP